MADTKTCSKCKRVLPYSEFNKSKATKDKHQTICRECHKRHDVNYKLILNYGITEVERDVMLINQGGRCKICKVILDSSCHTLRPHVDHDHISKQVRGVLCGSCNFAIGLFEDSPETLQRAISYLEGTNEPS